MIAGPNGAGKTSDARTSCKEAVGINAFINADVIARGLAGFIPAISFGGLPDTIEDEWIESVEELEEVMAVVDRLSVPWPR